MSYFFCNNIIDCTKFGELKNGEGPIVNGNTIFHDNNVRGQPFTELKGLFRVDLNKNESCVLLGELEHKFICPASFVYKGSDTGEWIHANGRIKEVENGIECKALGNDGLKGIIFVHLLFQGDTNA